jgi:hypothetical protein
VRQHDRLGAAIGRVCKHGQGTALVVGRHLPAPVLFGLPPHGGRRGISCACEIQRPRSRAACRHGNCAARRRQRSPSARPCSASWSIFERDPAEAGPRRHLRKSPSTGTAQCARVFAIRTRPPSALSCGQETAQP